MPEAEICHLELEISGGESLDAEQLDRATRALLGEIKELNVESAQLRPDGPVPEGAKAFGIAAIGALIVEVLPDTLPKLVEFAQSWISRKEGRTVKFKGVINGQRLEVEGVTPQELNRLLAKVGVTTTAKKRPT